MVKMVLYPSGSGTNPLAGSVIEMNAQDISYSAGAHIQVAQTAGKFTGSGGNFRLPIGKYLGLETPTMTIGGMIDTSGLSYANPDSAGNTVITGSILRGFISAGTVMLLDDSLIPNSPVFVLADGLSINRTAQTGRDTTEANKGYIHDYSLNVSEVKV